MKRSLGNKELKSIAAGASAIEFALELALIKSVPHVQVGPIIVGITKIGGTPTLLVANTNTQTFNSITL